MDYSERRIVSDKETRLITKYVRQLYKVDSRTKIGKWVDSAWSDENLAAALTEQFNISPPLTMWNVRSIRQKIGKKFVKYPTLPDNLKPKPASLPVENKDSKSNFFKSLTERITRLESRVAELEDVVTRPTVQLELPIPDLPRLPDDSDADSSDLHDVFEEWAKP